MHFNEKLSKLCKSLNWPKVCQMALKDILHHLESCPQTTLGIQNLPNIGNIAQIGRLYKGDRVGGRFSGVIFAYEVQIKVPNPGVSTLFTESRYIALVGKYLRSKILDSQLYIGKRG